MKGIRLHFGYYDYTSKWAKFTYKLCEKFPFIPTVELTLFYHYKDGSKAVYYHELYLGWFKWYWHIAKVYPRGTRKDPHWKFENLTGK